MTARVTAEELDARDPLAWLRDEFLIADDGLVYLDGNSLGMPARRALERLARVVHDEWGTRLVRAWNEGWFDLARRTGDRLGAALLGAAPGQVAVCDSTSVNLYKLAIAALDARPGRTVVIAEGGGFPTDRYVLQGIAASRGLALHAVDEGEHGVPTADAVRAIVDDRTALVCLAHVDFRSGAIADMAAVNAAAHAAGALTLWDVSHSVGCVPVALDATGSDLAVGCTYKYIGAGPGAPAFLYVRGELQDALRQPIWGWFGTHDVFAMAPDYQPASGVARYLTGTPSVIGTAMVDECVGLLAAAGIDALSTKSAALTQLAIELHDAWLAPLGFVLATPRHPAARGSHVALRHPEAFRVCRALIDRHAVIPDFRPPDIVRLGLAPATTRFTDAWDGLDAIRTVVASGTHLEMPDERGYVT